MLRIDCVKLFAEELLQFVVLGLLYQLLHQLQVDRLGMMLGGLQG